VDRCYRCDDEKSEKIKIPIIPDIHKAVLAAAMATPDSFDMQRWHVCETTHCRAGWAVHLAGPSGYDLEARTSPLFAAMQIYRASGYEISPTRFFDSNEVALADMMRLAEAE